MQTPSGQTGPINLGPAREFTIISLAQKVIRLTGSKSKIEFKPLPADDPVQRRPDIRRARDLLGWEPKINLEDGLRKTVEYFRTLRNDTAAR